MRMNDYQKDSFAFAIYPREIGLFYTALGLAGEAGEVANKIKKIYRDRDGILCRDDFDAIKAELGDCLWYIAAMATEFGLTLEEIAQANYDKLASRQSRAVLGGSGDDR